MLDELAASLLRDERFVSRDVGLAFMSLSGPLELLVSVVTLGFFSIWVRKRIERRQARRF
jgi:hypothetical protein